MNQINRHDKNTIQDAKQMVVDTGIKLVKSGLIARTWGNLSMRVNSHYMAITPSGRTYDDMTPDDIVLMNIADLSYEGRIKPSGEKKIHAAAYQLNPETRAVIHTHQMAASTVGGARREIEVTNPEWKKILGGNTVRCGVYALPGTGKLTRGAAKALINRKACLLANHGVICTGSSLEDAFNVALTLEKAAQAFIDSEFEKLTNQMASTENIHQYYLGRVL